jgi:hypothetical protein
MGMRVRRSFPQIEGEPLLLSLILILKLKFKTKESVCPECARRAQTMSTKQSNLLALQSNMSEPAQMLKLFAESSGMPGWTGILAAIAQDKRHDLPDHTLLLWKAKLEKYPEADIAQVLVAGSWKLFPSIDEVLEDLDAIADQRRLVLKDEHNRADQADRNAARRYWNEHPEVRSEVTRLSKALEEKLSMSQIREIHQEPPRSPRNVLALSQSKVLGKIPLPPKKQPHPITDTSAEWVKVAKAAKG